MSEALFYKGLQFEHLISLFPTWPYFVLLGLGISVSGLWLLRKNRTPRKPWTPDRRMYRDVIATYVTLQLFGLIHIFFYRFEGSTVSHDFRLFLIAFGIHL